MTLTRNQQGLVEAAEKGFFEWTSCIVEGKGRLIDYNAQISGSLPVHHNETSYGKTVWGVLENTRTQDQVSISRAYGADVRQDLQPRGAIQSMRLRIQNKYAPLPYLTATFWLNNSEQTSESFVRDLSQAQLFTAIAPQILSQLSSTSNGREVVAALHDRFGKLGFRYRSHGDTVTAARVLRAYRSLLHLTLPVGYLDYATTRRHVRWVLDAADKTLETIMLGCLSDTPEVKT